METWKHDTKWNEPDTKWQISKSPPIWNTKIGNLQKQKWIRGYQKLGKG